MSSNEKIIIIKKSDDNTYKCDLTKSYSPLESLSPVYIIAGFFLICFVIAVIVVTFGVQPSDDRLILLIIFGSLSLFMAILFIASLVDGIKESKKLRERLSKSVISLGIVISCKRNSALTGKYSITIKLDDSSETVDLVLGKFLLPSQKIAVAKNGTHQFLLTKITLIQN